MLDICQVEASVTVRSEPRGGGGGVLQYCPGIYIDISLSKDISFSLDWSWDKGILTL
jgi:hypothetical protein